MYSSPRDAYQSAAKASASNRDLESAALFKAARLLDGCRQGWDSPERPARLEEALTYHQRLWTFFQGELSHPANPLPAELRSWLLSLSVFLDKRTMELRANPDPAGLEALIRINREIAMGLASGDLKHPPAAIAGIEASSSGRTVRDSGE